MGLFLPDWLNEVKKTRLEEVLNTFTGFHFFLWQAVESPQITLHTIYFKEQTFLNFSAILCLELYLSALEEKSKNVMECSIVSKDTYSRILLDLYKKSMNAFLC
jgi:hypothetical protein